MKRIGILSDTHGKWEDKYALYFQDCDEIWHAGDIGDYSIIDRLTELGANVRAVSGNCDHGMVRRKCKELEIFKVEDVKVLLTHIGGYPGKWAPGMKRLLRDEKINLMVDGHSHILKIKYDPELNLLHINPGAAGEQGWHKVRTLVRLEIEGKEMKNCEIIEMGK
ncbi:MAG: YfcE family phosphodiesterase [Muribaculaceae bacterium]|nr:YfcE family phosphodiesterase [Muribaculaceae bacterium]